VSRRISFWVLIGIAVASCWVAVGLMLGPNYNLGRSTVVAITAPASLLGRRMPVGVLLVYSPEWRFVQYCWFRN
jgi:hypothetical protein